MELADVSGDNTVCVLFPIGVAAFNGQPDVQGVALGMVWLQHTFPRGRAIAETAEQLATVTLNGRLLPFGHGVLICALSGWHVALYDLPTAARALARKAGPLVIETTAGHHFSGDVMTEVATPAGEYLLLTGTGVLRRESAARVA